VLNVNNLWCFVWLHSIVGSLSNRHLKFIDKLIYWRYIIIIIIKLWCLFRFALSQWSAAVCRCLLYVYVVFLSGFSFVICLGFTLCSDYDFNRCMIEYSKAYTQNIMYLCSLCFAIVQIALRWRIEAEVVSGKGKKMFAVVKMYFVAVDTCITVII